MDTDELVKVTYRSPAKPTDEWLNFSEKYDKDYETITFYRKTVVDQPEALGAVVVVSVDNCKGRVANCFLRHQDGVGGAPGFDTAFRHGETFGQLFQLLESIAHLKPGTLGAYAHSLFERLLDLVLDDEHHRLKPGTAGIVQAVINNCLAAGPHGVDLLQTTVTAAHTGGHYHKDRFFRHK